VTKSTFRERLAEALGNGHDEPDNDVGAIRSPRSGWPIFAIPSRNLLWWPKICFDETEKGVGGTSRVSDFEVAASPRGDRCSGHGFPVPFPEPAASVALPRQKLTKGSSKASWEGRGLDESSTALI